MDFVIYHLIYKAITGRSCYAIQLPMNFQKIKSETKKKKKKKEKRKLISSSTNVKGDRLDYSSKYFFSLLKFQHDYKYGCLICDR